MTDSPPNTDEGLSLLDIGPLWENVPITGGKSLKVYGVSAKGIFLVFQKFPEVMKWFKGGKLDLKLLIDQAPDAIAGVIAAGCGLPGNVKAEERAGMLGVESQLDVLEAITRLSFKAGFGPFVLRIVALSEIAASLNYGRVPGTTLPLGSKPASPPASIQSTSGT